ncbi:MAG: histidine phosphatase family protein [Myxococcales bacterium]|nr:histidine phosphatase family protein [Myxococcales bacterium]
MELLIIRHGLPERVESSDGTPADPPLSAEGVQQAARMARWLEHEGIDCLYTSPMRRAQETVMPLAEQLGLEPRVDPGVAEFDQGSDSYVPIEQMKREGDPRWRELVASGWYSELDPAAFRQTVVASMETIIEENSGKRVAVVCHGGVINVWAAHVLRIDRNLFFNPFYTSINRFMASSRGHRSVKSLNETGHLRAL